MGYEGEYTLIARCGAEGMGTFVAIYLGEAILANEILPGTKGHELGFGWVAFGFGMAFFVAIQFFAFISAHLNPAMCLALLILGEISWYDFFALSFAEFLGAFIAACLVWIHYLPHFKTVPQPSIDEEQRLFCCGDPLPDTALHLASYNPKPLPHQGQGWRGAIKDVRYYLGDRYELEVEELLGAGYHTHVDDEQSNPAQQGPVSEPIVASLTDGNPLQRIRRRSVQVADLQKRLKQADLTKRLKLANENSESLLLECLALQKSENTQGNIGNYQNENVCEQSQCTPCEKSGDDSYKCQSDKALFEVKRVDELYRRAVIADQNGKLSIFSTRPAIYSPIFNAIVEFLGTFMLIIGALYIDQSTTHICVGKTLFSVGIKPFLLGIMIMVMILGLGGPTGFAANPARDLGPRIAHSILPIPGKGSSEWYYAWIPGLCTLAGGAAAGALFLALREMNITGDKCVDDLIDIVYND
eukprot:TRINITY_DN3591_c0_g1_i1.p1 TRINITY_DN3591_c0_g1~~TRINITY_DN3591_c0_g1_i1.p1  ORF type:complete len:500 (-),score=39.15 TRINITY_DN3591_c0_g1_i1:457-1869(-)